MMFGMGLAAVIVAQAAGAKALWPAPPAPRRATKGLLPLRAEEKNELVQENKALQHRLAMMTRERDRLSENEISAIEKQDEYLEERDKLQVRYDDLLKECRRLRKASIRSEIKDEDKN